MKKGLRKLIEIYFLIYLILFTGFRYQLNKPDLVRLNIIILGVLFVLLVGWSVVGKKPLIFPPHTEIYLFYIGTYLSSVFHSIDISRSGTETAILLIGAFLFWGTINIINLGWSRKSLIDSMLWVGLFHNIVKLTQVGISAYNGVADLCDRNSIVINPNLSAGFLGVVLVFALAVYFGNKTPKEKILPIVLIITSVILLFLTGSRSGYIGSVAGVVVVLALNVMYGTESNILSKRSLTIILIMLVTFVVAGTYVMRPFECGPRTESIDTRFTLWEAGIEVIQKYPFLGSGPGTFIVVAPELGFRHPHSVYNKILAEQGAFGMAISIILLMTLIKTLLIDSRNVELKIAGLAIIFTFLVNGLTDVPYTEPYIARYILIIMAIAVSTVIPKGDIINAEVD